MLTTLGLVRDGGWPLGLCGGCGRPFLWFHDPLYDTPLLVLASDRHESVGSGAQSHIKHQQGRGSRGE